MASRHVHGACRLDTVAPAAEAWCKMCYFFFFFFFAFEFFSQAPQVRGSSFPRFSLPRFRTPYNVASNLYSSENSSVNADEWAMANCGSSLAVVPLNTTGID
ncbi:hypothetical protein J3459_016341 [Metarhizium acridum]|nr:hypothetical protein J3459_016341 [Metarhizium acridum]